MTGVAAIIVAAGRGERLGGSGGPKQYRMLGASTVLARSLCPFVEHESIDAVLVVIHPQDRERYEAAVPRHPKLLAPVAGGQIRQQSVLNGLEALSAFNPEKVLIHDAARPFVTHGLISGVLAAVRPGTGAIPGTPVADTLKRRGPEDNVAETVSRDRLFAVQTPQGFVFSDILLAHRDVAMRGIADLTDDSAVAERAGMQVKIVAGDGGNMKITTTPDLESARSRLGANLPDVRTGNGYDVHRLTGGDHVMLCGIRIPAERSLEGHSDADVGLHALTDALLGTIGDGDIGSHFPPTDPQWRGASSDRFLAHACNLVRRAGGTITHLDVTLVCEAPRIGPHREAMRSRIAQIAGIDEGRVAVKATTNETIGFVGRREGIAAFATSTAVFGSIGEKRE